mmetsp:Transcript_68629/g.146957  ORF Transcript_68629/g.146957 Transcript_68629/m.146957 type:complete len:252 (-) Transcript_68629:2929-3684(-)
MSSLSLSFAAIFAAASASLASSASQTSSASSSFFRSRSHITSRLVPRSTSKAASFSWCCRASASTLSSVRDQSFIESKYLNPRGPASSTAEGSCPSSLISHIICKPCRRISAHSTALFFFSTSSLPLTTSCTNFSRFEMSRNSRSIFATRCALRLAYTLSRTGANSVRMSSGVSYFLIFPSASKHHMLVVEIDDRKWKVFSTPRRSASASLSGVIESTKWTEFSVWYSRTSVTVARVSAPDLGSISSSHSL